MMLAIYIYLIFLVISTFDINHDSFIIFITDYAFIFSRIMFFSQHTYLLNGPSFAQFSLCRAYFTERS